MFLLESESLMSFKQWIIKIFNIKPWDVKGQEHLKKNPAINPNTLQTMDYSHVNGGFRMVRNSDTLDSQGKPRWLGPVIVYGVDNNGLVYNTSFGDFTHCRPLNREDELPRLGRVIQKTEEFYFNRRKA